MSLPNSSPTGDLGEGEPQSPAGRGAAETDAGGIFTGRGMEAIGLGVLGLLLVYFLAISWRKWPDPMVDFGQQCYCIWRISQGAFLYHDFTWSYGPFSIFFNAALFHCFGRGIMVLATANLIIYGFILALAYLAFRVAWGWLAAFVATAVFISVFSFSHLLGVGNYNFATPYSGEAVHGMLLIIVSVFIAARWCAGPTRALALLLGLCGGMAVVIKPEFMLAIGVMGVAALGLRWWQRKWVRVSEFALLAAGAVMPTLAFTIWFARRESWTAAAIDASQAWWLVVVTQVQHESGQQMTFTGLSHPGTNALLELKSAFWALVVMAAIWVAGWLVNRDWSPMVRMSAALAAGVLIWFVHLPVGWMEAGRCLPGLMVVALLVTSARLTHEARVSGHAGQASVMAFLLVLLGGTMLARMPLFARIYHLGFFQAALAAMVVAALMVAELPRWTGKGIWGRRVTLLGCALVIGAGCCSIAAVSHGIRADQTEPVGWGRDRIYSTTRAIDGTGAIVNWVAERMRTVPSEAVVLVLPEGGMINYLSQHKTVEGFISRKGSESEYVDFVSHHPPDYVVLVTRDMTDVGIARWGAPGNFGSEIMKWVAANYSVAAKFGGDPLALDDHPGALIFRLKQN